jgi:tetratricopeptide (TPR) repeat protein
LTVGAAAIVAATLTVGGYSVRREAGRGYAGSLLAAAIEARRQAQTELELDRPDEAVELCAQALAWLDRPAARSPGDRTYRRERAVLLETLGHAHIAAGNPGLSVPAYKEAIDLLSKLLAGLPADFEVRSLLSGCLNRLGVVCRDTGRWDEAESAWFRGRMLCEKVPDPLVADPRVVRDRVGFLDQLGRLSLEAGRRGEGLDYATTAVATQTALACSESGTIEDRERLVDLGIKLAGAFTAVRQPVDAERALVQAREVIEHFPTDAQAAARHDDLAATVLALLAATICRDPARLAEAEGLLERALAIRERMTAGAQTNPDDLAKLAAVYDSLAGLCRNRKAFDQAEACYRRELDLRSRFASDPRARSRDRFDHGRALHNLADLSRERGASAEALSLARQAVDQLGSVYNDNVKDSEARTAFSYARWGLCALLLDRNDDRAAAEAVAAYLAIEPNGYEEPREAARFFCRCGELCRADPRRATRERDAAARTYADHAMTALRIAVRNGFRDLDDLETDAVYHSLRARADFQRLLHEVKERVAAGRDIDP